MGGVIWKSLLKLGGHRMKKRLKVAVVGTGAIASERHIPFLSKITQAQVVAICDVNKEAAEKVANRFRIPQIYKDTKEMLSKEQLDVVVLCTPPQTHANLALQAIEHGCHVIMEKPMALRSEECKAMVKAARYKDVKICVIHQMLFYPPVLKALQLVKEGSLGDFLGMRIFIANPVWLRTAEEDDWVHKLPGGIIGETGPHLVYLSRAFIGDIQDIDVRARKNTAYPWCLFDDYRIELVGDRGISSITALYASKHFAAEVDIYGTEGFLKLDLQAMTLLYNRRNSRRSGSVLISSLRQALQVSNGVLSNVVKAGIGKLYPGFAHEVIIKGFLSSIISGGPVPVSGEDGLATVETMEKIVNALNEKHRF